MSVYPTDSVDSLIRRQAFQSALIERGLDPLLGSIQDRMTCVQGLGLVMF